MADNDIALMAHLMRRAGFGATRDDLEAYCAKGYEATVEELLHPEDQPPIEYDLMCRYLPESYMGNTGQNDPTTQGWFHRMINTKRPLEEKIALFWHSVLCTGCSKVDHGYQVELQIDMFRRLGFGNFKTLLIEVSKDPAMVYFLDNCESHKDSINENYGRELLELFSVGAGMDGHPNYTEDDVRVCARAFTGWTLANNPPSYPYGRSPYEFRYDPTDHDASDKTFLGETGPWNGEDVIDIIVRQPSCARFVSRHLYNFFVADEVPVPSWQSIPPRDPEAIQILEKAFVENQYEIRPVLKVLFNSDFFKNARYTKIKSPAEVVVGTMRLVGDFTEVKPGTLALMRQCRYMGQDLHNPPSVEGWHTGKEWVDSGTLIERINFVADQVGNPDMPGVRSIVDRMAARGALTPEQFVDGCLDLIGPVEATEKTRNQLISYAGQAGELRGDTKETLTQFSNQVAEMLQLISATAEYQFG